MTLTTRLDSRPSVVNKEIYSDPKARKILQFLIRSPRTPITPEITPTDELRYPQLEALGPDATLALLSTMLEAKVLVADMVDKMPACPECGSAQVSTRYVCPKCYSYNIARSYLFEHLKCGKVADDETFRKGDQLICPKCQTVLHNFGVEYRAVGAWYKCANCTESFNMPSSAHFCRAKRHQFATDRTRLVPVYQYRLNPDLLGEIRREVLLYSEVLTTLEDMGLTAQAPGSLPGKSGQAQSFDVVTTARSGRWGGSKTIAIDVVTSESAISSDAVRIFAAKVKDAKPSESYLLAIPGVDSDAKALARNLRLVLVEAASLKEATTTLLSLGAFKDIAQ
ncbi:MAG: hypothetical protein ABSF82_01215 [Candidatus Bathyarchaeia archaeon]|jgi:ribosomal protein S27AE